ncbi:VanW family protein [Oryzobacter telluris]|uniref:VanW family protein n=1 Tax=Oryzobacter telluris TaxID=3149179 RepID=UPI00370D4961
MTLETLYDEVEWEEPQQPARSRWPLFTGLALLALVVAYVVAAAVLGNRVPRDTTVAGVAVGGQSAAAAKATLTSSFGDASGKPLTLASTAGKVEVAPKDVGLAVDVDETVDGLVGFSLLPADVWRHLAGGGAEPAVVTVNEPALTAAVEEARAELDAKPAEGSISLAGGTVKVTPPVSGTTVDPAGTVDEVRRWWPGETTVEVAATQVATKVSADELARVKAEFADVAVSAPVTVTAGGKTFDIAPKDYVGAVVLAPDDAGTITPRADDEKLSALVHAAAKKAKVEVEAKDAVVTFSGRTPTVKPHVAGLALDDASLRTEVWKAIGGTERTATVATKATEPTFTTAIAKKTLPKERISSFTTNFPAGQPRVHNIRLASRLINGTYVPPGEQFSMNAILGQRTPEKGYIKAGIIRAGRAAENYGGGISQVSTTIFNAAFFSGMKLDAWTPHYYYISRYPEGREATISWPDLHNKFTNVTDGGVLIQISTTSTSITVSFYGTKKYDIEATKSPRRNFVQPKKYTDDDPECLNQSPVPGFTVDVGRIFRQGGQVVKRESYTTTYRPEDDVTCTNQKPR